MHPGVAGIHLKGPNLNTAAAIIAACLPKCPATAAGIKAGDRIVQIDGRPITSRREAKQAIGRHYAGDKMRLTVLRGKEWLERELTWPKNSNPFQHGFLGVLPMRSVEDEGRHGPLTSIRKARPPRRESPPATCWSRWMETDRRPAANDREDRPAGAGGGRGNRGATGRFAAETEDRARVASEACRRRTCRRPPTLARRQSASRSSSRMGVDENAGVPERRSRLRARCRRLRDAAAASSSGCTARAGSDWKELLGQWKPLCDRYGLILVAPRSSSPLGWMPTDTALINRRADRRQLEASRDPARVVVHGYAERWIDGVLVGVQQPRDDSRVAAVEAAPMSLPPENEPLHRLAVYIASSPKSPMAAPIDWAATRCVK